MLETIFKHAAFLLATPVVVGSIVLSPALINELGCYIEQQKSKKPVVTYKAAANTLPPTLAENAEYRKEQEQ